MESPGFSRGEDVNSFLGTPLAGLVCAVTRRAEALSDREAVRRALLFTVPAGLLAPEIIVRSVELADSIWHI